MFNGKSLLLFNCFLLIGSISTESKLIDQPLTIKGLNMIYTQDQSDQGECFVKIEMNSDETKILHEGESIKLEKKWYKVEDCQVNRAYSAPCGSKLFVHLRDLSCSFVDQYAEIQSLIHQQSKTLLKKFFYSPSFHPCCQNVCTISEFIQACPRKW